MAHGSSGLGTNEKWADTERHTLLDALRDWREKDIAPDYLIAAHVHKEEEAEKVKFIRKVYPYKGDKEEGKERIQVYVDKGRGYSEEDIKKVCYDNFYNRFKDKIVSL